MVSIDLRVRDKLKIYKLGQTYNTLKIFLCQIQPSKKPSLTRLVNIIFYYQNPNQKFLNNLNQHLKTKI